MRGLLLLAVLGVGCVDSRVGVEPVCDVGDDGDTFGYYACDGYLAAGSAADWQVFCTDGSALSTRIDPETYALVVDCDGDCRGMFSACRTDQPTCPDGLEPVCVLADNVCEVAPDAYTCGG